MQHLLNKDFLVVKTFEDDNLYLLKKTDVREGIFTKYHHLFDGLLYEDCFMLRNLYDGDIFKIIDFDKIKRLSNNYIELNDFTPIEEYFNLLKSEKYTLLVTYKPFGSLSIIPVREEIDNLESLINNDLYIYDISKVNKSKYVEFISNSESNRKLYQLELSEIYSDNIDNIQWKDNKIECTINSNILVFELDKEINAYISNYEEN